MILSVLSQLLCELITMPPNFLKMGFLDLKTIPSCLQLGFQLVFLIEFLVKSFFKSRELIAYIGGILLSICQSNLVCIKQIRSISVNFKQRFQHAGAPGLDL